MDEEPSKKRETTKKISSFKIQESTVVPSTHLDHDMPASIFGVKNNNDEKLTGGLINPIVISKQPFKKGSKNIQKEKKK
jgi:hypothetical protein